jgi:hypothetical protein
MRKLIRRSWPPPEATGTDPQAASGRSEDDRKFLDLLKIYHRKQQFQYMREWWDQAGGDKANAKDHENPTQGAT